MDMMIPFQEDTVPAYLSDAGKDRALIVIHEIWGLDTHVKDVANRLQAQGYTALAPDLLKGTEIEDVVGVLKRVMEDPKERDSKQKELRDMLAPMQKPEFARLTVEKLQVCFHYLQSKGYEKIGVIGFCFGGTYSFALAAAQPSLKAAVAFYGQSPDEASIEKITCPVLAFYGEQDARLVGQLLQLEESMKKLHKEFSYTIYPNTGHAFFNDTRPTVYNKEAADDAWDRMLQFLKENMS